MAVALSPLFNGYQGFTINGVVSAGGLLNTYAAGTSTPLATFTDSSGGTPNTNPIQLGSDGYPPNEIWLTTGVAYKFVLTDSLGLNAKTFDNVTAPEGGLAAFIVSLASSAGSALVGFIQAGTGAVLRTLQAKARDTVSIADFGCTGSGDETTKVQAAVNSFTGVSCILDLAGLSISITTVNIPNGKAFTVKNGSVTVTGAGFGFSKVTATVAAPARDLVLDNVQFTRSVAAGACVFINLAWQDSSGGVIVLPNCSFTLTNGAYGVRLARSFGSCLGGRYTMDATSTGFMCDASEVVAADAYPSCPFVVNVDNAFFSGGIAFDQLFVSGSIWNSFEGISFGPGARFYASKFKATKYNSLRITGVEGASWNAVFDSGINTTINAGYFDRNTNGDFLIKVLTTLRDIQGFNIGGGVVLSAQGTTGDMVIFSDAGTAASKQITDVNIGSAYWVGGLNNVATPIRGIQFNHNACRNINIDGGQNFQNLYSCITFTQALNRSTIKSFEARDISWYAENVATGYGPIAGTNYNRFPGVYRVLNINMTCSNYTASGANEVVQICNPTFDDMMRAPVVAISGINSYFGAGYFTMTVPASYRNGIEIDLVKNIAAPTANRGGCLAVFALDASQYLAPL